MKKSRIVGFALTLASTLVVGSAMGQLPNYKEIKTAGTGTNIGAAATLDDTAFVQVGLKYGFYARPDAAFHPSYDASTNTGIVTGFNWSWSAVPGITQSGKSVNYVELQADATVTTAKVTVTENAPAAWGISCPGSDFDFYVTAFPAPSFTKKTGGDEDKKFCAAADAKVYFNVKSSGTPHFVYNVEKATGTLNVATGTITPGAFTSLAGFPKTVNTFAAADQWSYNVATGTNSTAVAAGADGEQFSVVYKLDSKNNKLASYDLMIQRHLTAAAAIDPAITVYRVTLNQVNGLISRNADFVQTTGNAGATEAFFPAVASTTEYHDFYVVKAPKTGPVYHIGNNVAK
jgi:hypothetical protein